MDDLLLYRGNYNDIRDRRILRGDKVFTIYYISIFFVRMYC